MKTHILICLLIFILTPSNIWAQKKGERVLVTTNKTDLKVEGTRLKTLHEGFAVTIKDIKGPWYWVNHQGTLGWIKASDAKTIDQAIQYYTDQIRTNPTASNYRFRGDAFRFTKKYQSALNDLNESIRLNPNSAKTYDSRANIYSKLGKRTNALNDMNTAIKLDPNSATRYNNRAVLLAGVSKRSEAIKDYTNAIRLNPQKAIYYKNRGLSYNKIKDYDSAIKDFDTAIQLVPTYADAFTRRGDSYYAQNNYDAAMKDYKKSLEIDPKDTYTNYRVGLINQNKDHFEQAIQNYNTAIRLNPKYRSAYRSRGICYRKLGNYSLALQDLDKAIQISPEYTSAYRSRAWLRSTASNPNFIDLKKAKSDLVQAEKLSSKKNWQLYQSLAALYAAEGKFDKAIEASKKSLALQKEVPTMRKILIQQSEERLKLYQQHKPYREIPQN